MSAYRIVDSSPHSFLWSSDIPFKMIDCPKNDSCADPFLYEIDGKIYVYCEYTVENKSKSFLARKLLFPHTSDKWEYVFEFPGHSSYPCIFGYNKKLYIIPETTYNCSVCLLQYNELRNQWEKIKTYLNNINAPDTTFFVYNNKPFLFVYEIKSVDYRVLHICSLDNYLNSIVNDDVVLEYHEKDGRPGGSCFFINDRCYRVVQPGCKTYGERIDIREFSFKESYYEKTIYTINYKDIKFESNYKIKGIHTFNRCSNIEVIDVNVQSKFNIFNPFIKVLKYLGIFGFGLYDKKQKMINY